MGVVRIMKVNSKVQDRHLVWELLGADLPITVEALVLRWGQLLFLPFVLC